MGVTAGVLKVLAAVRTATASAGSKDASAPGKASKKRKPAAAAAEDEKKQPKLSAFFTKKPPE